MIEVGALQIYALFLKITLYLQCSPLRFHVLSNKSPTFSLFFVVFVGVRSFIKLWKFRRHLSLEILLLLDILFYAFPTRFPFSFVFVRVRSFIQFWKIRTLFSLEICLLLQLLLLLLPLLLFALLRSGFCFARVVCGPMCCQMVLLCVVHIAGR